jgi:hypothetical protein
MTGARAEKQGGRHARGETQEARNNVKGAITNLRADVALYEIRDAVPLPRSQGLLLDFA